MVCILFFFDNLQNYNLLKQLLNPLTVGVVCYIVIHTACPLKVDTSFPPSIFIMQHEFTHLCYLSAFWIHFVSGPVLISLKIYFLKKEPLSIMSS